MTESNQKRQCEFQAIFGIFERKSYHQLSEMELNLEETTTKLITFEQNVCYLGRSEKELYFVQILSQRAIYIKLLASQFSFKTTSTAFEVLNLECTLCHIFLVHQLTPINTKPLHCLRVAFVSQDYNFQQQGGIITSQNLFAYQ